MTSPEPEGDRPPAEDRSADHSADQPTVGSADASVTSQAAGGGVDPDRDLDEVPAAASLVRPYALTAGRTSSAVYLPLEAPVHTVSPTVPGAWPPSDARAKIVVLCAEGPSVAEISARLKLPLGVARVLVGDLVESGIVRVSATLDDDATADERRELIGRTLRGLRAL